MFQPLHEEVWVKDYRLARVGPVLAYRHAALCRPVRTKSVSVFHEKTIV